ncbi:hypothetical protein SSX86_026269 [Deinandra increscens subsp. villosa]|uniref:Uncharacterized protein n=1 Tax=Deinandra increscens subsp. villosa TaxID=3103831 RepID=A0AAP0CJ96_9ASTR
MAAIEYRGLNAVTNFDLSRYIKWLRPDNTTTTLDAPPNPNIDIINATSTPPPPNHDQAIGTLKYLHINHHDQNQQPKPSATPPTLTYSTRSTNATSALGLLLQSSKFKEMMEMTTAVEFTSTSSDSTMAPPFAEEVQMHFESPGFGDYNAGGDDFIFGDLNFMDNMMHSEFQR